MVEVLHFMGGVIIPPRVLCPWRAHLLASTLPAVARATAACFVRCEWMVGRGCDEEHIWFRGRSLYLINIKFQRKGVRDNLGAWRFDTVL